jgi:hypothetical protein
LCESFRFDGRIRHRVIVGLGKLDDLPTEEQKKLLVQRGEELLTGQGNSLPLFETDEAVKKLAHYYLSQIKKKGRYDYGRAGTDWQTVDISTLKNKDGREIGAEWLCKQAFDR